MINWWNSKTIPVASRVWKPGLNPISSTKSNTNSWYNASIERHANPVDLSLIDALKTKSLDITRKIKLNPTKEQKEKLTEWWHGYRFIYNKVIEDIGSHPDANHFVVATLKIQEDKVKLNLDPRFEMPRKWVLKINYNEIKMKVKLKYTKKKGCKLTIVIVEDSVVKPIDVEFQFQYPEVKSFYDYRNNYATAKIVQNPKNIPNYQEYTSTELKLLNTRDLYLENPWLLNIDTRIRACACRDARAAYQTIKTMASNYNVKGTQGPLPFKSKRGESWSISMEKTCIVPVIIAKKYIGRKKKKRKKRNNIPGFKVCSQQLKTAIKCYEQLPDTFGDPKIHKDQYGDWWLLLPIKKLLEVSNKKKPKIALDPGISTFLTGYSTNGNIYNYVSENPMDILKKISYLQHRIDIKDTLINRKQEKITKLRKRIKNQIDDMHWKVINHLTQTHNEIILGKFNVQSILKSGTITKAAKRKLQTLGHYKFKTRLFYKSEAKGVSVKQWSEWGTTKGCPCCGKSNTLSLSERTFHCVNCNYEAGRDAKAACCIFIKYEAKVW
jgi:transposase